MDAILDRMISDVEASGCFSPADIADLRELRGAGGLKKAVEVLRLVRAGSEVTD